VKLGAVAKVQNGFAFKSELFTKEKRGMPIIRIRDVGSDNTDTYYTGEYDPEYVVRRGDLLIGMDGDFNSARWRGPDALLNQRVCRIIPTTDHFEPRLLDFALPGYLKAINDVTSSVTVKHLSSRTVAEIPLRLPPLPEQRRIVSAIETQLVRLDAAVARLHAAKAKLKRYKQAVLKAAFTDEDWPIVRIGDVYEVFVGQLQVARSRSSGTERCHGSVALKWRSARSTKRGRGSPPKHWAIRRNACILPER